MPNRLTATNRQYRAWRVLRSDQLASLARRVLVAEAELTPKPGLVDRRGSGAHRDLSLQLLRRSASVLEPYFSRMALASARHPAVGTGLREELAAIGRDAERAMYRATRGSNAHKGAIWTLGLLVAAAARTERPDSQEIAGVAGAIARLPDRTGPAPITHGDIVRLRHGVMGARGEAADSFPHVIQHGLPALRSRRAAGCSLQISQLDALLAIMARLDDTCVLYRGGSAAASLVQYGARAVLVAGGYASDRGRQQLRELDQGLLTEFISPGGSADLLAATLFLDALERRDSEIGPDGCEQARCHGAA